MKLETEKGDKVLKYILTDKHPWTEGLIHAGAKMTGNEIGLPRGNPNSNTKSDKKTSLEDK